MYQIDNMYLLHSFPNFISLGPGVMDKRGNIGSKYLHGLLGFQWLIELLDFMNYTFLALLYFLEAISSAKYR